jgi:hypothetical protein
MMYHCSRMVARLAVSELRRSFGDDSAQSGQSWVLVEDSLELIRYLFWGDVCA